MALKTIFPGLGSFMKGGAPDQRYFVGGRGEIRLGRSDFKAQGGEGSIYVKGAEAYKIYTDPSRAITPAKIVELSTLTLPNIIKPLEVVIDGKNRPVGYSMRAVGRSYALCQLFPKAFRQRNNLTPELTFALVRKLQEGVSHVHAAGILIVDLNEMNFLVSENFRELFFIDVDSYQTPSYPATVLMESVRDRHAQTFTKGSDWFSFAIVSFQMFVGIHPYKGNYPPLQGLAEKDQKLNARMQSNVSVLRPEVSVPSSCLPFSLIPPVYLDWYRAVFENGRRLPPPEDVQAVASIIAAVPKPTTLSADFEITEVRAFDSEILWHDAQFTVTETSVYFAGHRLARPYGDLKVAITPRLRRVVAAYMNGSTTHIRNLSDSVDLPLGIDVEQMMSFNGQLYVKQRDNIFAIELLEPGGKVMLGLKSVANVMINATRLFEGVAIQSLLGACFVSAFPSPGRCYQVRISELDRYQIVEARLDQNVLVVVGTHSGRYDKFIFRFTNTFAEYDSRTVRDVSSIDINFTVLDTGVVLHITDEGTLEVFLRLKGSSHLSTFRDPGVASDARLFHVGRQALMARGNKLYKLSMRQE